MGSIHVKRLLLWPDKRTREIPFTLQEIARLSTCSFQYIVGISCGREVSQLLQNFLLPRIRDPHLTQIEYCSLDESLRNNAGADVYFEGS